MGHTETLVFAVHRKHVLNANKMLHHQVKAKHIKHLRTLSKTLGTQHKNKHTNTTGEPFPTFPVFTILFKVYQPQKRWIDPPNFSPTSKALIDGLTDAGWWEDDNLEHSLETTFQYGGLSGIPETYVFEMTITEPADTSKYVLTRNHETNIREKVEQTL
jgi:hypothetical protein